MILYGLDSRPVYLKGVAISVRNNNHLSQP